MWTEPTKTGKVKFVEQFKNPLTLKYTRVSITMDKETNSTRKLAQQALNKRIEEKLRRLQDGHIKEGVTFGELIEEFNQYYHQTVKPSSFASWQTIKGIIQKNFNMQMVLYPVKVTLKKIKISLYGLIAEVLRGEVVSFAGNLDCVEVFNTLLNQIFQFCQSLRM